MIFSMCFFFNLFLPGPYFPGVWGVNRVFDRDKNLFSQSTAEEEWYCTWQPLNSCCSVIKWGSCARQICPLKDLLVFDTGRFRLLLSVPDNIGFLQIYILLKSQIHFVSPETTVILLCSKSSDPTDQNSHFRRTEQDTGAISLQLP